MALLICIGGTEVPIMEHLGDYDVDNAAEICDHMWALTMDDSTKLSGAKTKLAALEVKQDSAPLQMVTVEGWTLVRVLGPQTLEEVREHIPPEYMYSIQPRIDSMKGTQISFLVGFCCPEELRQRVLADWKALGWVSGIVKNHTLYSDVVGMPEGYGEYLYWPSPKSAEGGINDAISITVDKQAEQALNTLLINKISLLGVFYPPMPITQAKAPSPASILFASRRGPGESGAVEGEKGAPGTMRNARTANATTCGASMVQGGGADYDYRNTISNNSMAMRAHKYADHLGWNPNPEHQSFIFGHEDASIMQPNIHPDPSTVSSKKGSSHNKIRSVAPHKEQRQDNSVESTPPLHSISPQTQSPHSMSNSSLLPSSMWGPNCVSNMWSTGVGDMASRNDRNPWHQGEHYGLDPRHHSGDWDAGDYQYPISNLPYVTQYVDLLHQGSSSSESSPYFGPSDPPTTESSTTGCVRPPKTVDMPIPPKTSEVPVPSFMSKGMAKSKISSPEPSGGEAQAIVSTEPEETEILSSWMQ